VSWEESGEGGGVKLKGLKWTHEVGDEEADQTLVDGVHHVHPEHVGLVLLRTPQTPW